MKWDVEMGFMLFAVGMTINEIADKYELHKSTVAERARRDDWEGRKVEFLRERALRVGGSVSKEQEFLRSQEADLSRRLLGLAHEMLRTLVRSPKTDVADLVRVIDMASTLGRRATGLPMQAIELSVSHDIGEDVKRMLDKAYGSAPAQVVDVEATKQLADTTTPSGSPEPAKGQNDPVS